MLIVLYQVMILQEKYHLKVQIIIGIQYQKISSANLFYLIGNKTDLYDQEEVPESEAREYAKNNNMRFFLTSCKLKIGINEFLEDSAEELDKFQLYLVFIILINL